MFWKKNMLFKPEFLEKSGKMEFQDYYQPCSEKISKVLIVGLKNLYLANSGHKNFVKQKAP